jgi:serine/threonine-protein kinase
MDLLEQLRTALGRDYEIERELGGGGMSRVFVATERRLARRVVIKVLHPALAAGISGERFEREILLAARLQNPRLVPVLAAGDVGGLPYFTMPYVDGESLRARLARGPLGRDEAIAILRDVAMALEYAHRHDVIHRDIKPENVLLSGDTALVADFGIAKALSHATGPGRLTTVNLAIGTPAYMAPEQAVGGAVDQRTDIYAWGILAWELLAGAHPFAGKPSPQSLVAAHLTESVPPLATKAPSVPAPVAAVIEQALAKDPDARPQSMTAVIAALDQARSSTRSSPMASASLRRRTMIAVTALAAVAGATLVARWVARRGPATTPPALAGSVAVLDFAIDGSDTTIGYFAEGIADEINTALLRIPGIRVASRTAASHFRPGATPITEIARALSVAAVLEGRVRRLGPDLRVTVQLTRGTDGLAIWGGTWARRTTDVLALQDTISRTILAELAPNVTGLRSGADGAYGTTDREAYRLFLKARYFFDRRGEAGLRAAIDSFTAAIDLDQRFARAWAGRAMARAVLPVFAAGPEALDGLAEAGRDAVRALAIDSTLADAHLAMGQALKMQWRWSEAERHFRAAVALAPEEALPHHWFGVHLYAVGRPEESVTELARARSMDPYGSTIGTDGALALYAARRYADARAEIARAIALDSLKSDSYAVLTSIHLLLDHPDSALEAAATARRLGSAMDLRGREAAALARLGRMREAAAIAKGLERQVDPSLDRPIAALAIGDRAGALAAIERLVAQRPMLVTEQSLPCDPLLSALHEERRFVELLRSAGMQACTGSARPH